MRTLPVRKLALLALILSLQGCATPLPPSRPAIPPMDSVLMSDESSFSEDFLARLRAWQLKAAQELLDLHQKLEHCKKQPKTCA